MEYVAAAVIGYLLGSIPVAAIVARRHGVDLYATGDRNPGAWNALEQLGGRRAWPAFVGDGLKGSLAGLAGWLLGDFWTAWTGVAAAMAGHALPAFARLRGGKSVMTFVGGAIVLSPPAALVSAVACALVTLGRSFAWGARVAVFGFPVAQLAFDPVERVIATGWLMAFIGALFGIGALRARTSGRASAGPGAGPTK